MPPPPYPADSATTRVSTAAEWLPDTCLLDHRNHYIAALEQGLLALVLQVRTVCAETDSSVGSSPSRGFLLGCTFAGATSVYFGNHTRMLLPAISLIGVLAFFFLLDRCLNSWQKRRSVSSCVNPLRSQEAESPPRSAVCRHHVQYLQVLRFLSAVRRITGIRVCWLGLALALNDALQQYPTLFPPCSVHAVWFFWLLCGFSGWEWDCCAVHLACLLCSPHIWLLQWTMPGLLLRCFPVPLSVQLQGFHVGNLSGCVQCQGQEAPRYGSGRSTLFWKLEKTGEMGGKGGNGKFSGFSVEKWNVLGQRPPPGMFVLLRVRVVESGQQQLPLRPRRVLGVLAKSGSLGHNVLGCPQLRTILPLGSPTHPPFPLIFTHFPPSPPPPAFSSRTKITSRRDG